MSLAFRFRALKKIPTEILRACTQVRAEAEPLLYQGNKFFFETFTLFNAFRERIPSEKLFSLEKVSLYGVFPWMHFHNGPAILKNFLVAASCLRTFLLGSFWMEDDMRKLAAVLPNMIHCLPNGHPTLRRRPLARLEEGVR